MATGTTEWTSDLGITPEDYQRMIRTLQRHGNFVVLTQQEYDGLRTPLFGSTPNRMDAGASKPPMDRRRGLMEALEDAYTYPKKPQPFSSDSAAETSASSEGKQPKPTQQDTTLRQAPRELPKLPIFSGDETGAKLEISYEVWRFEARCLVSDGTLEDHLILQAIRASLRGTARQMLIPLGEKASISDVLKKLDTLFGNVSSAETVLQQFYTASQSDKESVTAYGCRLETLLQTAIQAGHVAKSSGNDMLRSRFWTGLRDDKLKSQTRHKFDSIRDFDHLLREIRAVEQEMISGAHPKKAQQHAVTANSGDSDQKIDKMADQMDKLLKKLKILEEKVDGVSSGATKSDSRQGGSGNGPGPGTGYGGYYPAGGWNRGGAGRGNPRGFGRRGSFNRPPRSLRGGRGTDRKEAEN